MFVLRAQDMASRPVRNLATTFSRFGREIERLDNVLRTQLTQSQARVNAETNRARDAYARAATPLQTVNDRLRSQNARLAENRTALRTANDVRGAFLQGLQREITATNNSVTARRNELDSINKRLSSGRELSRMTSQEAQALRNRVPIIRGQIAQEQELLNVQRFKAAGMQQANISRTNSIRSIDQVIARNRTQIAQNMEVANSERRIRDAAIAQVKDTEAARQAQMRDEHRRAVQRQQIQQQQVQQQFMLGAALTTFGAIATGIGLSVVNSFIGMVRATADLQLGFAQAQVQSAGTVQSVGQLRDIARDVAMEIPAAYGQMDRVLFRIFTSTNASVGEAQVMLRAFATESVAAQADMEAAARSTIAIMNALDMGTEDLARIQDVQFEVIRRGVITYDELSASIGRALPATRRAGQSIETLGAMFSFLTRNGLDARMAATSAARALESFAHPRTVARLEDMGIQVRDVNGEFLPLVDVIGQLNGVMGNMTTPERTAAMQELFMGSGGTIQARRFWDTALANFAQFEMHIRFMENSTGAMRQAYDIMFGEPAVLLDLLNNHIAIFRDMIGEALIGGMRPLIGAFIQLVQWLTGMDEGMREAIVRTIALGGVLLTVAGAVTTAAGMIIVFNAAVAASSFSMGAVLTAIGAVSGGIVALGIVLAGIIYYWDDITRAISRTIDWLGRSEVQIQLVAVAASLLAIAFAGVVAGSTGIIGAVMRIGNMAMTAAGGVAGLTKALWAIATHPVVIAIGAIAGAFWLLTRDSREAARAQEQYATSMWDTRDAILQSEASVLNYKNIMQDAAREVANSRIAESNLLDVMAQSTDFRQDEVVNAIIGEGNARQEMLRDIDREIAALDRNVDSQGHVSTSRMYDIDASDVQRQGLGRLRDTILAEAEAHDAARQEMIQRLRMTDELGYALADYITMSESTSIADLIGADAAKQRLIEMVKLQGGVEELDPAMQQLIEQYGLEEEALEASNEVMIEATRLREAWGTALDALLSPTNAWQAALEKVTEAAGDNADAIDNSSVTLKGWTDELNIAHNNTSEMFTNMSAIVRNNSESMAGDTHMTMGAILEMGEAGPHAMALLASASPDEFEEILRGIRLHAAMTSESVIEMVDEMMFNMDHIIESYKGVTDAKMGEIWEATTVVIAQTGTDNKAAVYDMMIGMAEEVENNGDLSVSEMIKIGTLLVNAAEEGGRDTVDALAEELDMAPEEVRRILGVVDVTSASGLQELAETWRRGGQNAYEAFSDITGVTPATIARILEDGKVSSDTGHRLITGAWESGGQDSLNALMAALDPTPRDIENLLNNANLTSQQRMALIEATWLHGGEDSLSALMRELNPAPAEVEGVLQSVNSNSDSQMAALEASMTAGGERARDGLIAALRAGTATVGAISHGYGVTITNGINPVLRGLGRPLISMPRAITAAQLNTGGEVPGSGPDRDSVLAHLTPGEYVVRRKAVDKIGKHNLDKLNQTGAMEVCEHTSKHDTNMPYVSDAIAIARAARMHEDSAAPSKQATISKIRSRGQWYGLNYAPARWNVPAAISSWRGNAGAIGINSGRSPHGPSETVGISEINNPSRQANGLYWPQHNNIQLNWAYGSRLSTFQRRGTSAHEIGHALGLGHVGNPRSVMYASNVAGRANAPGAYERDILRRMYPMKREEDRQQPTQPNQIEGGRLTSAAAPGARDDNRFWWVDDIPKPPSHYRPPIHPITASAAAADKEKYDQAVSFVRQHGAPPITGPFPTGAGDSGVWRTLKAAIEGGVSGARVTSAYRPGARTAASGRRSFHSMGRAVDIVGNGRMDTGTMGRAARWIAQRYPNATELIYSPGPSLIRGRRYNPTGITRANHWDHVHWAMANGGVINEPVFGVGASGQTYSFGETGPEQVTPLNSGGIVPDLGPYLNSPNVSSPGGRGIPKSLKGDDLKAMRAEIAATKELLKVREMDYRQHLAHLTKKINAEIKYSNDWLRLVNEREDVIKNAYEAQQQHIQRMAQERMQMEDNLFSYERMRADQYVKLLDVRIASEKKYTNEWMSLQRQRQDVIEAEQRKTWDLVRSDLQAQLQLMSAQERVAELRELVNQGGRGSAEREAAVATLQEAKAAVAYAEFDAARLHGLADAIEEHDSLRALLMRFEAEAGLAEANKAMAEAKEEMDRQTDSAKELRKAEIELTLAEMDLVEASQASSKARLEVQNRTATEIEKYGALYSELVRLTSAYKTLQDVAFGSKGGDEWNLNAGGVVGSHRGVDARMIEGGLLSTMERVKAIFDNRRVRIATATESEQQRLLRIANEVMSGARTLDSVRKSVDNLRKMNIDTYDSGGILPPGVTLAVNKTGKPEGIFTQEQMKNMGGKTITVEKGAVELNFNGPVDSASIDDVKNYVDKTFEELIDQLRRN